MCEVLIEVDDEYPYHIMGIVHQVVCHQVVQELFENGGDTPNANGRYNFTLYNNNYSVVHTYAGEDEDNGIYPVGQFVKSGDLLYASQPESYVGNRVQ